MSHLSKILKTNSNSKEKNEIMRQGAACLMRLLMSESSGVTWKFGKNIESIHLPSLRRKRKFNQVRSG